MRPDHLAMTCALACVCAMPASAHRADSGQDYSKFRQRNGTSCCNGEDCRPVRYQVRPDGSVVMFPNGQPVVVMPQLLNEQPSDDGHAHWCGLILPGGLAQTYCAILPRQMTRWNEQKSQPTAASTLGSFVLSLWEARLPRGDGLRAAPVCRGQR